MKPLVTIIIPCRNEEKYIEKCIYSIINSNYKSSMEIIIADGMSEDATRDKLREINKKIGIIKILDNPGLIAPIGLNTAITSAKGEIIIRVDGHCVIAPDYISNCVKHLLEDEIDGVGGPMKTIGETPISESIAIAMSSVFGVGDSSFRTTNGKTKLVESIPFPAYTRKIIEKVGLYDEELVRNQDDEYNYRILDAGGKLLLASDVQSTYYSRGSIGRLWKQYYQYGFWKVRVLQKHHRQMRPRQFVPPLFVFALLSALMFSWFVPWGKIILFSIIGSYLVANLIASTTISIKKGWRHFIYLPVIFAALHLSYGSGFLIGLIKFANRWNDKKGKLPTFLPHQTSIE
jgi:glycosyltransferase involved in cell wall biosynthesis